MDELLLETGDLLVLEASDNLVLEDGGSPATVPLFLFHMQTQGMA
jgi:hypothetical protein